VLRQRTPFFLEHALHLFSSVPRFDASLLCVAPVSFFLDGMASFSGNKGFSLFISFINFLPFFGFFNKTVRDPSLGPFILRPVTFQFYSFFSDFSSARFFPPTPGKGANEISLDAVPEFE